jgi:hypothetical protein
MKLQCIIFQNVKYKLKQIKTFQRYVAFVKLVFLSRNLVIQKFEVNCNIVVQIYYSIFTHKNHAYLRV